MSKVFRDASHSTAKPSNRRLVQFSKERPGRLAKHLLEKMRSKVVVEGEALSESRVPACAKAYLLRVFCPHYQHVPQQTRNLVEGNVIAHCLDHFAQGRYDQAADILAQRFTAIEANLLGIAWDKARFLELVELDDNSLVGRHERALVAHETTVESKLKAATPLLTPAAAVAGSWQGKGGAAKGQPWETTSKGYGKKANPFRDQEREAELEDPNGAKGTFKGRGGKKGKKTKWW